MQEVLMREDSQQRIKKLVLMGVFMAIMIIQTVVPFIGFIDFLPVRVTLMHITVIIGAIILGTEYGAMLGIFFGFVSLIKNTLTPNATSFCFSPFVPIGEYYGGIKSVIVCFVPRVLVGVVSSLVYKMFVSLGKNKLGIVVSAVLGSLTNTIFVMGFIFIFFFKEFSSVFASARNIALENVSKAIIALIGTQGILEAIASIIITYAVVMALKKA
jgi:hypothetical protein